MNGKVAEVLIDDIKIEIKCLINTLNLQNNLKKLDSFLNYKKFDLIRMIGGLRAGLILLIEKNSMIILDDLVFIFN